jgi:hypothetical protein
MDNEKQLTEKLEGTTFRCSPNFHTGDKVPFVVFGIGQAEIGIPVGDAREFAEILMNAAAEAEYMAAAYLHCIENGLTHEEAGTTILDIKDKLAEVRQREYVKRRMKVAEINTVLPSMNPKKARRN